MRYCLCWILVGWSSLLWADTFKAIVGQALPPYIIETEDRGGELDIVRQALALAGHQLETVYVPFGRIRMMLENGHGDLGFPLQPGGDQDSLWYSAEHMAYTNAVFGLYERNLQVRGISDLAFYSVLAFQKASQYLGPEFQAMTESNHAYAEIMRQQSQIEMLLAGRVDLVVLDENIFRYYLRMIEAGDIANTKRRVQVWHLFEPTPYRVGFRSESLQKTFDQGLAELRASGRYDAILNQWFGNYQD